MELLKKVLEFEEGLKLNAYKDSEGIWHIGYGHNLEIDQTPEELKVLGPEFVKFYDEERHDFEVLSITQEQADALLMVDVDDAIDDLHPAFTKDDVNKLNDARYVILISMAFQMGGGGVRKFKNFILAVKEERWDDAANEMLFADPEVGRKSRWFIKTPKRCQRAADAMRLGFIAMFQETPRVPTNVEVSNPVEKVEIMLADAEEDQLLNVIDILVDELRKRRQ